MMMGFDSVTYMHIVEKPTSQPSAQQRNEGGLWKEDYLPVIGRSSDVEQRDQEPSKEILKEGVQWLRSMLDEINNQTR